jgi:hypothetical protein
MLLGVVEKLFTGDFFYNNLTIEDSGFASSLLRIP